MERIQGPGAAGGPGGTARPRRTGPARITRLDCGDFVLTVNPVDGSEIEARRPDAPETAVGRRTAEDRAARDEAALPPVPAGADLSAPLLLERDEDRDRAVRLLARGRSVRITGPAGSGRSAFLDAVAAECAGLAPDGIVRLGGLRRTAGDLLHALHAAVFDAPQRRPDLAELLGRTKEIGAVVVIDDFELGDAGLEELLRATPECAFLLAVAPGSPAAGHTGPTEHLDEIALAGLTRSAAVALLEHALLRPLGTEEADWAGDLWFASEGLPRHFVQAAALLRQRDAVNHTGEDEDDEEPGVFEERARETGQVGLPTLGQAAAPAVLLASRLSESARATLRFAVALGGEVPHPAHLPALVGDTHADAAVGELLGCGLLSPAGARYRLAAGVLPQLEEAGYGDEAAEQALTAAGHYTWWTGHGSVTPERAAAEADAVLAVLAAVVPGPAGHEEAAAAAGVLLARAAAPAFAGGLQWGAWERILHTGQEAARIAGEVAEEAYFHHERGILALCNGQLDRARAELEASIGLRGALADKRGTVAGRRALALVDDREGGPRVAGPLSPPLVLEAPKPSEALTQALPKSALPALSGLGSEAAAAADAVKTAFPKLTPPSEVTATPPQPVIPVVPPGAPAAPARPALLRGARRNILAAAGAAVLVAVLGTVVALGPSGNDQPSGGPRSGQSVSGGQSSGPATGDPDDATTTEPGDGFTPGAGPAGQSGGSTGGADGTTGAAGTTGTGGTPGTTSPGTSPSPSGPGGSSHPSPPATSGGQGGGTSTPGSTGSTTGDTGTTGSTTGDTGTTGSTNGDTGTTGSTTGDTGTTGSTTGDTGTTGSTTGDTGTTGTTTGSTTGDTTGDTTSGTNSAATSGTGTTAGNGGTP
ncbi:ATP-binding protein [Streptomyces bambusae]|uniref:ATP-binding protein n=1 Tax=Streptomyces bambusae TaxID=1550616 RepID=UPI001CFDF5F9|nr:ATP-binding protein [Streptomyces bambusae]MCB5165176.1 ATP-binding protein [Streptomyces bambusae]